jgi:hypothetical protein
MKAKKKTTTKTNTNMPKDLNLSTNSTCPSRHRLGQPDDGETIDRGDEVAAARFWSRR